jgi:pilus assembly protein CpaE
MSETVNKSTGILLPSAGVDLFIRDHATMEAARSLIDDWRFARVIVNVEEGDVETAISSYQQTASPALVIIETDTTDQSFIDRLEVLAGYCAEGTSAIIIGPVNDVNLYRSLTSMGVGDYLVRPVSRDTMSEVIASSLINQLGASDSRLIAVTGAKGGVGATALTEALALGISEKLHQKTFLLDAAGGWSSMSVGMGFEPSATLAEAARAAMNRDEDTLKRMLFKANDKLHVLATGAEPMLDASVQAPQYEELLDMVMTSYPVVIVDLSSAVPSLKRTVINRAHELIIVSTPTLPSLRATRSMMSEIKTLHGGSTSGIDIIINMAGMIPGKEVPKRDIADALEREPAVTVPFNPKLFIGLEGEGKNILADKEGHAIVESLLPLAQKLLSINNNEEKPDDVAGGVLGQILGKLKR